MVLSHLPVCSSSEIHAPDHFTVFYEQAIRFPHFAFVIEQGVFKKGMH